MIQVISAKNGQMNMRSTADCAGEWVWVEYRVESQWEVDTMQLCSRCGMDRMVEAGLVAKSSVITSARIP